MRTKLFLIALLAPCITKCYEIPNFTETQFTDTRSYSSRGYNLTIKSTDGKLNAAVRQRLTELYFDVYPRLVDRFNPNAPRSVHLFIDDQKKYPFWGLAVDSMILINAYRLRQPRFFPRYYDVFLHELTHLVQQYTTQNLADVKWLGEGLADYVRYTYGAANLDADWPLLDYTSAQTYDDSYKVTARFLIWLEYKYNSSVIDALDRGLRQVTYTQDTTWLHLTGKSVEQLWSEYSQSADLIGHVPFFKMTGTMDNLTDDDVQNKKQNEDA